MIVVYSREGCPKCDEVRAVLESGGIEFNEVDVANDPALEAEYGSLVPVVEDDGRIVFEAGMNPEELKTLPFARG